MTTYFPEMLSVPDGSGLNLLWQEQDSLEGPNPGALLDPLCRTNAVGQARHCAGAQAHFPGQVPEPLWDLRWRGCCSSTAGAHQTAQGVEGPVHGALAIAVISAHVTPCGAKRENHHQYGAGGHHAVMWCVATTTDNTMQALLIFLSFHGSSALTHTVPFCMLLRIVFLISPKPLIRNPKGWAIPADILQAWYVHRPAKTHLF